jgi:hypothetical protein
VEAEHADDPVEDDDRGGEHAAGLKLEQQSRLPRLASSNSGAVSTSDGDRPPVAGGAG